MQQTYFISREIVITNYSLHHYIPVVEIQADGFHDNIMYYLLGLIDLGQVVKMPQTPTVYTKLYTFLF